MESEKELALKINEQAKELDELKKKNPPYSTMVISKTVVEELTKLNAE